MNFRITVLKALQEAELRILTSILFHSIVTAEKKRIFEKNCFCLEKKDLTFFNTSRTIGGLFLELVEIDNQVIFLKLIYKQAEFFQPTS